MTAPAGPVATPVVVQLLEDLRCNSSHTTTEWWNKRRSLLLRALVTEAGPELAAMLPGQLLVDQVLGREEDLVGAVLSHCHDDAIAEAALQRPGAVRLVLDGCEELALFGASTRRGKLPIVVAGEGMVVLNVASGQASETVSAAPSVVRFPVEITQSEPLRRGPGGRVALIGPAAIGDLELGDAILEVRLG